MKALRIIKYNERHESQASRGFKNLNYINAPVAQNSRGWKRLKMRGEFHAIGVYIILAEFAGTLPIRGVLASEEEPYALDDISIYTDIPYAVLEEGMNILTHESCGFIDLVDWPVDPRLIQVNRYRSGKNKDQVASRIILPWSIDSEGEVIDSQGLSIDSNAPVFEGQTIETAFHSRPNRFKPPSTQDPSDSKSHTKPKPKTRNKKHKPETEEGTARPGRASPPVSASGENSLNRSSGSDSGPRSAPPPPPTDDDPARRKALQLWRLRASRLFAPRGTSQHHSDDTASTRLFDDHLWPEGMEPSEAQRRIEQAAQLIDQAATRRTPMAWLTKRIQALDGKAVA